jgi:ATP-dependent Lon protease
VEEFAYEFINALWKIKIGRNKAQDFPQYELAALNEYVPKSLIDQKALRCVLEKKYREYLERTRKRNVPKIIPEFIDETPYFQEKMQEFIINAKLQLMQGSGLILLSGPPSTGKSAFLQFIAAIMNREYFDVCRS